jgi:c-di-GMP-binding flagellar brake protein YcgR
MRTSSQLERRRFERAPITAQVEYELTNASAGPTRVRKCLANVSVGGLFINSTEPLRAGTRMVVRFELPNKYRVIAVSRVCYTRKGMGFGVEFLGLDEADRQEIQAYVSSVKGNAHGSRFKQLDSTR